ncbi:glycosyltransferase family 39 protein [Nocardia sp. NPDC050697]|uniref:glycosyltransferase family 39 protein n=1 Tax=Nocardia sp. NPDC050697 TaxID=3155158 RepID=UPI0034029F1B
MPTAAPAPARRNERLALAALLAGTALAYLWNLSANGWANSFYAAAVQSGTKSWTAFLFGSSDWGNAITVDKTPAALWPMELSGRLLGFSSWSMLLPQVLLGVGSVALLWVIVRRWFGAAAGFVAGLVLAATPVAALMFRFNNPDALLVFLMIGACWALLRAVEDDRVRWLVLCGVLVGLGFLAKQLQVMLVLPALVVTYLVAARGGFGRRVVRLGAAAGGLVLGAGWWLLLAVLWPAGSRPYFGGSQHNSTIELALGYNGLDRLGNFGSAGGGGRPPGGGPFGRAPGIGRLFDASVGGQIAWFVPAAMVLVVVGLVLCRREGPRRAVLLLFGVWGLVTGVVFSFMHGIFHEYYTVALAPAVAGAVGAGGVVAWGARERLWVRVALAVAMVLTGVTAFVLLGRAEGFVPWLRWVVVVATVLAVAGLLDVFQRRALVVVTLVAVAVGALAGPVAYVVQTVSSPHRGGIVLAGPDTGGGFGGPPGAGPGGAPPGMPGSGGPPSGAVREGPPPDAGAGLDAVPPGLPPASGGPSAAEPDVTHPPAGGAAPNGTGGPGRAGPRRGPMGAPPDPGVIAKLRADAGNFRWAGATVASMGAADYQLAADVPIMPIGGFAGGDPAPTLAEFQRYVADGDIHWFLALGPGRNRESEGTRITEWVQGTFTPVPLGEVTLYDLTAPR